MNINKFKEIKQFREKEKYGLYDANNHHENGVMDYYKNVNRWVNNWQEEDSGEGGFTTWLLIVDKYDIFDVCCDDSGYESYYTVNHKELIDKPIVAKIKLGSTNMSVVDVIVDADQEWLNEDGKELLEALKIIYPIEYFEYIYCNHLDT
jgi:hypothetical protein